MANLFRTFYLWIKKIFLPKDEFLCDSCQLNYHTVCKRTERPNAVSCSDYLPR